MVEEYLRVLDYPRIRKFKKITDASLADIAAYLVHQTERVELASNIRLSPDPDDDVFLETAVDGEAKRHAGYGRPKPICCHWERCAAFPLFRRVR